MSQRLCKCTRCKNQHREDERVRSKPRNGFTNIVCPRCNCREFYDMSQLTVSVTHRNNTYVARCLGKTASATAGPEEAAVTCLKKVVPGYEFALTESDNKGRYLAEIKEV